MPTATIRVISIFLLTACGALCQSERRSADVFRQDGSISPKVQHQEIGTWRSLPDAPSVQLPMQAEKFQTFVDEARSLLALSGVGVTAGTMRETELGQVTLGLKPSFSAPYKVVLTQNKSSVFVDKYLYPSLLRQSLRYHPSTSGSFMGRATYAASQSFVTRDDSGKRRLNTSYFLGVLTSVATQTAHSPYWMRSSSATFNNFGSTIGSDAGIDLFHEFEPGMRQMVKGRVPTFLSKRVEGRIAHDPIPTEGVFSTAR